MELKNYAKIEGNSVVEVIKNSDRMKPAGVFWKELVTKTPKEKVEGEFFAHSHFEILEDAVVEYLKKVEVNYEPEPTSEEGEM